MATITISVNKIARNERYRSLLKNLQQEIFLTGDSIQGNCQIIPQKSGKLKHRGITVRLVGKYVSSDTVSNEFEVQEMKIAQPGIIDQKFSATFTFEKPRIQYPSYHGYKMGLTYHIIVEIKQGALRPDLNQSYEIAFLEPIKRVKPVPPISIPVTQPQYCFDVFTDKGIYSSDETISGEISFGNTVPGALQKVAINMVLIEKIKEKKDNTKSEENAILKYELIDGCPRSGAKIPFRIRLAPYCIWTIKNNQSAYLTATFRLEVYIQKDGSTTQVAQHPIIVYQRELA